MLIGFVRQLRWPFDIIARAISEWSKQKARYQSLQDLFAYENTIVDGTDNLYVDEGKIEYSNITFGYNAEKNIIKNFSLSIPGGTTCALV
jgi:ABC-type multidrug transport system fused ATPase/permease subunit